MGHRPHVSLTLAGLCCAQTGRHSPVLYIRSEATLAFDVFRPSPVPPRMSTMKVVTLPSFALFYTDLDALQDSYQSEQNREYMRLSVRSRKVSGMTETRLGRFGHPESSQQLRPDEVEMLLKECDDMLIETEGMAPSQS